MNKSDMRIVFMGTPEFAAIILKSLADNGYNVVLSICQPDKPVGRKHILTAPPVKELSNELGIECYQPDSMKSDEAFTRISDAKPDIIVTAAYGKILPQRVLDIPSFGCINCHGSLLPARRGAAPVQRAILEGDKNTGVTIMKMDAGMDTGDIITKCVVDIDENIHTDELMTKLATVGARLLIDTIDDYVAGELGSTPQSMCSIEPTMCPPIRPEEGHFDWSEPAIRIHNRVRALSSWPGAFTETSDGGKIKIYDTRVVAPDESIPEEYVPGTVVKAHKKELVVKCGEGYLQINQLQLAGGKKLCSQDVAHNYKPGDKLA